jgi:hypothetical protein
VIVVDLVRWLGSQLDTDAEKARAAAEELGGSSLGAEWIYDGQYVVANRERDLVAVGSQDFMTPEIGEHIAEHDPARVLREIDAKRKLIGWHRQTTQEEFSSGAYRTVGCRCYDGWPCTTLRLLALPYADRPGYREEWAP